jgi:hypothetical protein
VDYFEILMKFPAGLRADEKFVIESVAKEFAGTWGWGVRGKCPDAYLTFNASAIAMEITTLTQYVTDDRGTGPRASDDAPIDRLVDCLNAKLHDLIPARIQLVLFSAPHEARLPQAQRSVPRELSKRCPRGSEATALALEMPC